LLVFTGKATGVEAMASSGQFLGAGGKFELLVQSVRVYLAVSLLFLPAHAAADIVLAGARRCRL